MSSPILTSQMSGQMAMSITKLSTPELAGQNIVWFNEGDLKHLFPNNEEKIISIANLIFRAEPLNGVAAGTIALNGIQTREIRFNVFIQNDAEYVYVSTLTNSHHNLEKVVFDLSRDPDSDYWANSGTVNLDLDLLRKAVKEHFVGQVFFRNQSLLLCHPQGNFRLICKKPQTASQETAIHSGKLCPTTNVEFQAEKSSQIHIVEHVVTEDVGHFVFTLKLTEDEQTQNRLPMPMRWDMEAFKKDVLKHFRDRSAVEGYKFSINKKNGWIFNYQLSRVNKLKNEEEDCFHHCYQKAYTIDNPSKVDIKWNPDEIVMTQEIAFKAVELEFKILNHTNSNFDNERKAHRKEWISIAECREKIKALNSPFGVNQMIHLKLDSGEYEVQLQRAQGEPDCLDDSENEYKNLWEIGKETEINITLEKDLELTLVDDSKSYPLTEVKVEVKPKTQFFFESDKITLLSEKDLKKTFLAEFKKKILQKSSVKSQVGDEENITLTIASMIPKEPLDVQKGFVGLLTEDTKITFEASSGSKAKIMPNESKVEIDDPVAYLETLGVGGLSGQMQQIVRNILLGRGKMRKQMLRRGCQPPRGILFFGPPGTGKTTLARSLSKMLGALGENVQMISAPEVFNKLVGESEKNIRELFKPARDAQNRLKDKSPLYVVIIDEIDSILSTRTDDTNKWKNGVVNQFLSDLDGPNKLNNILVIGMTNRKDHIDPAALRSGRLELQIEIGIPTKEARKTIFNIHTKALVEEKLLHQDVDFNRLVELTDNWSGADIESLVKRAVNYSLERLSKIKLSEEEIDNHPDGMTRQIDFLNSLKEIKKMKVDNDHLEEYANFYL